MAQTYDFNLTAADIAIAALRIIGAKEDGEAATASQINEAIQSLNIVVKSWQAQGIHLWRKREGVLFLEYGKARYLLGPTGDRTTEESDFIETTLDGAHLSGETSLTLESTTGMLAGDNIGIRIDTQTRHWTTIVSVDSSTTLTITTGLSGASTSGSSVYTYTNLIERPLRILHGRRRAGGPSIGEIPTFDISRKDYFDLTNRNTTRGLPVEHSYTPTLGNGELFLWPPSSNVDYLFKFTFTKPLADFDVNSDFADFPQEWLRALKWNLASEIVSEYRNPLNERGWIQEKADSFLNDVLSFDKEYTPSYIVPNFRG